MKLVSQLDAQGYFVAPVVAEPSPLEPGAFLIPGGAVDAEPPGVSVGMRARWSAGAWAMEPVPPDPEEVPPTFAQRLEAWHARIRAQRTPIFNVLDHLQATANTKALQAYLAATPDMALANEQTTKAAAIEACKEGLRAATDPGVIAVNDAMTDEQLDATALAYYGALVAAAPADVRVAFKQVAG